MGIIGDIFDVTPTGMFVNYLGDNFGPAVLSADDQAANIEAMHLYIAGAMPNNAEARKIQEDWIKWYAGLSWYQKHVDESIGLEAFNRRNDFMRANTKSSEEKDKVNAFLKKTPVIDPVTGKPTLVLPNGDRALPPKPWIPEKYKVIAVATASGVAALTVLKKLHII